jgi:lysophospholipase L1-like esterase
MYNPASILHTISKFSILNSKFSIIKTAFLTLGTNHVYILKETNEIVDNCEKRPQSLFVEKELTVDECADYLRQSIDLLRQLNPDVRIVITVSPIRYRKYGYHGSQLSKATLLLAVDKVIKMFNVKCLMFNVNYFPAYEIINDELRDYRFYAEDMLHPSAQAVEYIWQRFSEVYLSDAAKTFIKEWQPIKAALNHKPFNPDSQEYHTFMDKTMLKVAELQKKYPNFAL